MKDSSPREIRVLIVDDIPETRENLKKLLYFESDIEVVGTANGGTEAIPLVRDLQPDIVLMDINMPGLDGISASELIARQSPTAQIIMMSVQGEADYLRRSMLAGAREFLIKPFSGDELVSSIHRVHELGAAKRASFAESVMAALPAGPAVNALTGAKSSGGKVLAVFAPKGGVGRSTIAINLAVALQEISSHEKVLLVDANLQFGGIDVLLNLQSQQTIVDLAEKVDDIDVEFIESVVNSHTSGIKVLLAPPRPEMADMVSPEHMGRILTELGKVYDYVIVDMRSALHDLELTILDAAARIILVTTPEIPAIRNTKVFFDVTGALEYPAEKTILVVNEADRRGSIRPEDIEASIRHPIAATLPLDERVASTAVNQGVPFVMTHRNSLIAQSIVELARRLSADLHPAPEAAQGTNEAHSVKSSGLFGKLFRAA